MYPIARRAGMSVCGVSPPVTQDDMMMGMMRHALELMLLAWIASAALGADRHVYHSESRYAPPAEAFTTPAQLDTLRAELKEAPAQAAARLDALLRDHADELLIPEKSLMISVFQWQATLSPEERAALSGEYRKQFDAPARDALSALRNNASARPEDFYAMARRWPLSSSAQAALVEAGDRAVMVSDAFSATAFYDSALRDGWKPDAAHAVTLALCRTYVEPQGEAPAGASTVYRGAVAFDASWYGRAESAGKARYFPIAFDGLTFLPSNRGVIALRDNGTQAWSWAPQNPPTAQMDRDRNEGRGPLFQFGALGKSGTVLVLRQQRRDSRDMALRAWRASDGKLLWTTDSTPGFESATFLSPPLVAGRSVFATALVFSNNNTADLALIAVDIADGKLLWRTTLGDVNPIQRFRDDDRRGWDGFWEQAAPSVSGDKVFVTPNVGMAMAVGRFDGKLRWIRTYQELASPEVEPLKGKMRRVGQGGDVRDPPGAAQLQRYDGRSALVGGATPALVLAPLDSAAVFGLNPENGALLWQDPAPIAPTLIAASGDCAIFAGPYVHAIEAATGKTRWRYAPALPAIVTGPPAVVGEMVFVPTSERLVALSALTGKVVESKLKPPTLRAWIAQPTLKQLLNEARTLESFTTPGK